MITISGESIMFGTGIVGSSHNVPQWILDLVEDVESWYGFCTDGIYYKEAKQKDYYGGNYYPRRKAIDFYFSPEKTDRAVFVVLHELAHAWQHLEAPETITPKPKGRRRNIVHNDAFFQFARELYIKYDVLEAAAKHEYKRARKMMVA
jgi:Zn-dependent peptidase ImmA (M78 family)